MTLRPNRGKSTRSTAGRIGNVALCLSAAITAGCATDNMISHGPAVNNSAGLPVSTLIPNQAIQVTPALSLSVQNMIVGALIVWAVDPLAPNWQLAQSPLGADRMRISMRKKRFTSGGDGEAAQLFARRAEKLKSEGGYAAYAVLEYTEGIESGLPIAQRVAQGVIELKR